MNELLQLSATAAATDARALRERARVPRRRRAGRARYRRDVNACFGRCDALLCPSAPGEAPAGMATGDPIFQFTWTLLGVPCLNLPVASGPHDLPRGVQLVGRRHDDARVLVLGQHLMQGYVPSPARSADA